MIETDNANVAVDGSPQVTLEEDLVHAATNGDDLPAEDEGKPSLIHRMLSGFYDIFHKLRWVMLLVSIAAVVVSAIFASHLVLPQFRLVSQAWWSSCRRDHFALLCSAC